MKITVFTSNQPRHISLIESLANIADEVFAIQECNTVFPGKVEGFFKKSDIMQKYFTRVISAEKEVFGNLKFTSPNVTQLILKPGDLNLLDINILSPALKSDIYIVFGSNYIKGDLIDFLIQQKALNIHMGVSPYYRGSSCNFWAMFDDNPHLVGATIHLLSKGLDSGNILFHAIPKPEEIDPFVLGMKSVKVAHSALIEYIKTDLLHRFIPLKQNRELEIRYTKNKDFNDIVAKQYLNNLPSPKRVYEKCKNRQLELFFNPFVG